jgi:hypothetical protein
VVLTDADAVPETRADGDTDAEPECVELLADDMLTETDGESDGLVDDDTHSETVGETDTDDVADGKADGE